MLRVFHAGPWPAVGREISLDGAESSHLVRVRRARVNEPVEVLDGRGGVARGEVAQNDNPRSATIRVVQVTKHPLPTGKVLVVGLPKGDGLMEIVRQATELGATAVQPLLTSRTEVNWDADRAEHKLERWRAAALEAGKQSGNPWLPEIHAPLEMGTWLKHLPTAGKGSLRLVAALTPEAVPMAQLETQNAKRETIICVGPEGDFSPEEYAAFKTAGFQFVRLPGHVLRVETACVVILSILN
jgi:16S rRNA (uracil1498-N3)-methyltransferase